MNLTLSIHKGLDGIVQYVVWFSVMSNVVKGREERLRTHDRLQAVSYIMSEAQRIAEGIERAEG